MKTKIDTLLFYVKNIKLLRDFYEENFDLKVIEEDEIWVLMTDGTMKIAFHKIGDHYLEKISENHQFDNNVKIVFEIEEDSEDVRSKFLAKKIQMRELKTFDDYDFWLCDGIDPEGNVFQLKCRKTNLNF
ncbi:VOC family protein [Halpernia sp. GG3]